MASRNNSRRLITALALWLFWPFYPFYALYLGRDTHCWLYTITFGGFGVGWLLDGLAMPLYLADHNEPSGYAERAEARHHAWFAWSAMFFPARWAILAGIAIYFSFVLAYLVPPDAVLEPVAATLYERALGERVEVGTLSLVVFRLLVGVVGASLGLRLATPCVLTVRRCCCWRHMLGWGCLTVALVMGTEDTLERIQSEGLAPQLAVAALATTVGALRGRRFAPRRAPKYTTRHWYTARLVRQAIGVGLFVLACGGAFYQNGSFTHTDRATNETHTYTGGEAMHKFYENMQDLGGNASSVISQLRMQYRNATWGDILAELREAFADPKVEAAEVLQVKRDASVAEVRKAHRELARRYHPDKAGDSAEAQQKMSKLNWAKDVMLGHNTD